MENKKVVVVTSGQQYAEYGIRVNCVLPGPTNTPLLKKVFRMKHPLSVVLNAYR